MLNLELVHYSAEGLLEFVNLFVELLSDLDFELVVQVLGDVDRDVMLFDFSAHFLDHLLHFFYFWRDAHDFVLHLCMLEHTLRTEHRPACLAVELDLLLRMHLTVSDRRQDRDLLLGVVLLALLGRAHGQSRQHLVVDR